MKKVLVIYHHPCLDGAAAAWVAGSAFSSARFDVHYLPTTYGKDEPTLLSLCEDALVYVVDFSFPRSVLEQMAVVARSICILDHHATAKPILDELNLHPIKTKAGTHIESCFAVGQSGVGITWDWFHPNTPMFTIFEAIQDRDLWQWRLPDTNEITLAIASYGMGHETITEIMNVPLEQLKAEGSALARNLKTQVASILAQGPAFFYSDDEFSNIPVYNCPGFLASEVGNVVVKEQDEHHFCITFYEGQEGRKYSFRSKTSAPDVAAFAQRFGGGGHRNAAGLNVPLHRIDPIRISR